MTHDAALLKLSFSLRVRLSEVVEQVVEPLTDKFVTRLGSNKIVFVGKVPVRFGVVLRVNLPFVE